MVTETPFKDDFIFGDGNSIGFHESSGVGGIASSSQVRSRHGEILDGRNKQPGMSLVSKRRSKHLEDGDCGSGRVLGREGGGEPVGKEERRCAMGVIGGREMWVRISWVGWG